MDMTISTSTFDNLIYDDTQHVLQYLTLDDITNLACASKSFSQLVQEHWETLSRKKSFGDQLSTFLRSQLALMKDYEIVASFKNSEKALGSIYTQCLRLCFTKRQSLVNFGNVSYVNDPDYYGTIYEEELQRNVLHLKTICWLNLSHQFSDVAPGHYKIIMRLKFAPNFVWPQSRYPAIASIKWSDSVGSHEQNTAIFFSQWYDIRSKVKKGSEYHCSQGFYALNYDFEHGWFDLCFENIHLLSHCDLSFSFKDTSNPWWKEGILLDFVELQPVLKTNTFRI